ncbi:MAG: VIT1/CCC1 transporter family protein [Pseudomonadota bacterium]|jgi:vacuolar iron transporter family protein
MRHAERHRSGVVGWLRAAVLGANDGIVSTASLLVGIAASGADRQGLVVAGVAALVAGAAAMAAGEYVSVASQADTERADLERERGELAADPAAEQGELAAIYVGRGLAPDLAVQVARQLMAHDGLAAHARDELGLSDQLAARPMQAALASAASFAAGAGWPLLVLVLAPRASLTAWLVGGSLVGLAVLGVLAAHIGRAARVRSAMRILGWGAAAMALTAAAGALFPA